MPPVLVSCSPQSGGSFPLGNTTVNCTATDAARQQATCSFQVTLRSILSRASTFVAFGDSVTEGENGLAGPGFHVQWPGSRPRVPDDPAVAPARRFPDPEHPRDQRRPGRRARERGHVPASDGAEPSPAGFAACARGVQRFDLRRRGGGRPDCRRDPPGHPDRARSRRPVHLRQHDHAARTGTPHAARGRPSSRRTQRIAQVVADERAVLVESVRRVSWPGSAAGGRWAAPHAPTAIRCWPRSSSP